MVFQRGNLFDHLSALENVLVGMSHGGVPDALAHLEAVGMGSKAGQRAGLLSGGEQGRVAFARAAARKTPILLADEPVAGLDDGNATIVLDLLAGEARRGVAVVVVSHDDRVTSIGTRHLRLCKGEAA
jgi:putative ABC transport system ATP-binding protein